MKTKLKTEKPIDTALIDRIQDPLIRQQFRNCAAKVDAGKLLSPAEMAWVMNHTAEARKRGKRFSTQRGVARYLDVQEDTVRIWIQKNIIPAKSVDQSGSRGWWSSDLDSAYNKHKRIKEAKPRAIVSDPTGIRRGAAHALKRLNEDEAKCHADYQCSRKSGDPEAIKLRRDTWREALDDQRRHEKAVELDRRELGELMPQAQAARIFSATGTAMLHACDTAIKRAARRIPSADCAITGADAIRRSMVECSLAAFVMAQAGGRLPAWAMEAFRESSTSAIATQTD